MRLVTLKAESCCMIAQVQYKLTFEDDNLAQALRELDTGRLMAVLQQAMHVQSGSPCLHCGAARVIAASI